MFQLLLYISANVRETGRANVFEALKEKIKSGEIAVDNSSDDSTKPTVSEFTTVNYIQ